MLPYSCEKLDAVRKRMEEQNIDAVIIGTNDPHMSPSVASHWRAVQWLTGFSGSLASCAVTKNASAFWTDGRYTLQAKRELESSQTEIYTLSDRSAPDTVEWIENNIQHGGCVALDMSLVSLSEGRALCGRLASLGISVRGLDLISEVWRGRPEIPNKKLFELSAAYAGLPRAEKINSVREKMAEAKTDCYLCCQLDSVAWLTNLRGGDNKLYPVFHSYLLFTEHETYLFLDTSKLSEELRSKLCSESFTIKPSEALPEIIKRESENKTVYIDAFKTSYKLYSYLSKTSRIIEGMDFITQIKARKNPAEQENIRKSNVKECLAVCRLIKYIKENAGNIPMNEFSVGEKMAEFRKLDSEFLQAANVPIVAVGENAALPHYKPTKESAMPVEKSGFLLFDLCAHYLTGSTDITRTIQLGELTEEMRRDYTFVLKSHIALAALTFPFGVTGAVLDGIVKSYHWRNHMNYDTGTGHGIGFCMDIHEGPCKIVMDYTPFFPYAAITPLDTGMLFSNEPGVYKKGRHGIRLENDVLVQEDVTNEFGRFLKFETVTFCPFEQGAIIAELLTPQEREWLNSYHKTTYEKISPHMTEEEKKWLMHETLPI